MNPIVSVIIPVYQSERYLQRCMTSVVHQTCKELEIIVVNDGSTDRSSQIVKEWAEQDERIVIVEQENAGVYAARNKALSLVRTPYVMFVDSDDWIEETMIEELKSLMIEHNADVVQSHFYYADDEKLMLDERFVGEDEVTILTNELAMKELVKNERVKNFTWGKLLKTELVKQVPFQEGLKFEDVTWAHQLVRRIKRYVFMQKPLYYYYQRDDSLVHSYSLQNLNIFNGLKERHAFLEQYYPSLLPESYKLIVETVFSHYRLLFSHRKRVDPNGNERLKLYIFVKQSKTEMIKAVQGNRDLCITLQLFCLHPYLFYFYLLCKKGFRLLTIIRPSPDIKVFHFAKDS